MKAVVIEPENDRLAPLISGCSKLMLNIMDRPLIYHISDYLSGWGIPVAGIKPAENFPEDFSKRLSADELMDFLKESDEDIILLSRPGITDISLEAFINSKQPDDEITGISCCGRDTGIYIVPKNFKPGNSVIRKAELPGYFNPLETEEEYLLCHRDILSGKLSVVTEANSENRGVIMGENTLLEIGARINPPVFIGNGTVVESGAKIEAFSVIGANCVISSGACTGGSVINKGCFIGADAVLDKALLAPLVRVRKKAVINELSVIGEAAVIGESANIHSGISVWNNKYASDGQEITENITKGTRFPVLSFSGNSVYGRPGEDFSAEDICRLGACFSRLNPNLRIVVASDESSSSLMIKYAFISGIMSVGGEVADAGTVPLCVLKFAPTHLKAAAGVYISEDTECKISFYSRDFKELRSKDMMRLKNMYPDGNFARCGMTGIKPMVTASNISKIYFEKSAALLKKEKIRRYVYCEFRECEAEYIRYLSRKTGITVMDKKRKGYISANLSKNNFEICDENGRVLSEKEIYELKKLASEGISESISADDRVFFFFKICALLFSK